MASFLHRALAALLLVHAGSLGADGLCTVATMLGCFTDPGTAPRLLYARAPNRYSKHGNGGDVDFGWLAARAMHPHGARAW